MSAMKILRDEERFHVGERVIVVSDIIAGAGIDAIQIRTIPDFDA